MTVLAGVASVGLYFADARRHPTGPAGDTVAGLIFGSAALAIMCFLVALSLKRRVPHWRLGSAATWMRAHIWLGLLTPLLVALHGAFKLGGPMTTGLCIVLGIVTLSGIVGLALQQTLPAMLRHSVRQETVAQQLDRELQALITLAEGRTETANGRTKVVQPGVVLNCAGTSIEHTIPDPPDEPPDDKPNSATPTGVQIAKAIRAHEPLPGAEPIRRFYLEQGRAFLAGQPGTRLGNLSNSEAMFASVRTSTPAHLHRFVDELESLCQRRRELLRQKQLMRVLHAWLFVHVPLSWALLLATIVHAVVALRY